MNDDHRTGGRRKSELRLALQKLTQGLGVARTDLLDALDDELGVLRPYWGQNLERLDGGDKVKAQRLARIAITANLSMHINRLRPPQGRPKEDYDRAVQVGFNVLHKGVYVALKGLDLTRRLAWLENRAPESDRVPSRTSRSYIRRAIDQIEKQLLEADYKPVIVDDQAIEASGGSPGVIQASTDESVANAAEGETSVGRKVTRRTIALVAAASLALSLGGALGLPKLLGNSGDPSGQPALGASPVPAPTASPPVLVKSVTGMRSREGDDNFVVPDTLHMTASELERFNGFFPKTKEFSPWYAEHGGVPIHLGLTTITLQGNAKGKVRITDMKAIKDCRSPFNGTHFQAFTQGAPNDTIKLGINLDTPDPGVQEMVFTVAHDLEPVGENYFLLKTIDLAPGEVQTLTIGARTDRYGLHLHAEDVYGCA